MKRSLFLPLILCSLVMVPSLSASTCGSTTTCVLTLDQGNASSSFGSGDFGTVTLTRVTDVVTVNVQLAPGWLIGGGNGFPGAFGFVDTLGGGLTIGGFSSSLYSGSISDATNDLHFDGFGFANDAGATSHPIGAAGINQVSFTVSTATLNDVNELVNLFAPAGGDGQALFVVDAFNGSGMGGGQGNTGLLSAQPGGVVVQGATPEPSSYLVLLIAGFGAIVFLVERRRRSRLLA